MIDFGMAQTVRFTPCSRWGADRSRATYAGANWDLIARVAPGRRRRDSLRDPRRAASIIFLLLAMIGFQAVASAQGRNQPASLPAAARARSLRARELADAGQIEKAAAEMEAAIRIAPTSPMLRSTLGVLYDQLGRTREANTQFREAARLSPRSAAEQNDLALSYVKLQQPDEAIAALTKSLALDPKQVSVLVQLGQLYLQTGQPVRARQLLTRAERLSPNKPEIVYHAIQADLARGDATAAIAGAERLRQLVPDDFNAHAGLGVLFREQGHYDAAILAFQHANGLSPNHEELLYQLALAWLGKGDGVSAERSLLKSQALSASPRGLSALSRAHTMAGKPNDALTAIERALALDPQNEEWRFQRGVLLIGARGAVAARAQLESESAGRALSAKERLALALGYIEEKKPAEATRELDASLALNPRDPLAQMLRGSTAGQLGDYERAASAFARAVELDAGNALAHFLLGFTQSKLAGQRVQAERALRQSLALNAKFAPAHRQLGVLLAESARLVEAEKSLARAAELDPDSAETQYQLGVLYRRLKQPARAQEALSRFERLNATGKNEDVYGLVK